LSTYTLTDLGTLGGPYSVANAINNAGQVAGGSLPAGAPSGHPFLWDATNGMQDLGVLHEVSNTVVTSAGLGINSQGVVVGQSAVDSLRFHAFLYQDGMMTDLAALAGLDPRANSAAYGINDAGEAVGFAFFGNGEEHAFFWDGTNPAQDLGTFGGSISFAYGVNSSGQVVGTADFPGDEGRDAFLWDNTNGLQDLHLPGSANAINDAGQIVGFSGHAFLYSDGQVTDLGTLPGFRFGSAAAAINNSGQIVGEALGGDILHDHAFVYADGTMTDLNDLIPPDTALTMVQATGINDAGQIVGFATDRQSDFHAVLLTPDDGSAPRVERGVGRLLASGAAAPRVVATALSPQALPAPLRPAPETVTLLPAEAKLREATDTVFASSLRAQTPTPATEWDLTELELGPTPMLSL
jgi:probable HAF family extracellular repeat protein